jgi:hypothetical protein
MRGCVSETKLLLNPPTMDLKLFVLGGGQLSEDTPNFHREHKQSYFWLSRMQEYRTTTWREREEKG